MWTKIKQMCDLLLTKTPPICHNGAIVVEHGKAQQGGNPAGLKIYDPPIGTAGLSLDAHIIPQLYICQAVGM